MASHEKRVVTELEELSEKIEKLESFFDTEIFSKLNVIDQKLLQKQIEPMKQYAKVLTARIKRF